MDKKIMDRRINLYHILGFLCYLMQFFVRKLPAFEDQSFLCGALIGASIVLLLQGVFFMGRNIAKSRDEKKDKS